MALILTLGEIVRALGEGAQYVGEQAVLTRRATALSTDSRACGAEALFVALRGDRFDGHNFIADIFAKQALAAIVDAQWFQSNQKALGNFIIVENTLAALQKIGSTIRKRWGKNIVAITGSNGKTTTKEMIASVLQQKFFTHKTTGNLNNHIGVPLTLSELTHSPEIAVVEMGTNHFGEIAALCEIAAPNFGVITNVGRAHTEFLGDLAGVAKAKGELFEYLHRNDGIAFLNADDAHLRGALPSGAKAITFGIDRPAQYHGKVLGLDENGCVQLEVQKTQIRLNMPGLHHSHNALAAVAIGSFLGVPMTGIKKGLENFETPAKRMQVQRLHGVTIINDAYNANPESMRAALQFLAAMSPAEHGRRIAILGDMLELGPHADEYHREIGEFITTLPIQAVFAFGAHMKHAVQAIGRYCWAEHFETKPALFAEVNRSLRAGDVVLLKGSRSMAMEEVMARLILDA